MTTLGKGIGLACIGTVYAALILGAVLALNDVLKHYGAHACVAQAKASDAFDDLTWIS